MSNGALREHLRSTDMDLYHRFEAARLHLTSLLEYSQSGGGLFFTQHGLSHVNRLEAAYDWLLSAEDVSGFNSTETFVLLVATYCHDLLMIPRRPGDETRAREQHAEGVADFLARSGVDVTDHEARAIGDVVLGHAVWDMTEIPAETVLGAQLVDLRKLAACLSIADICDADERRAPRIVFDYLSLDEASAEHWRRHLQVAGVTRRGDELIMSAFCYSDEGEKAVAEYTAEIERQLRIVRPYFSEVLWPLVKVKLLLTRQASAVNMPLSFKADTAAVLKLLMEGVYQSDDVFIRELVQNGLDACLLAHANAFRTHQHYRPRIIVSFTERDMWDASIVRVDDNGVGMSIANVRDTLMTIAASQATTKSVASILEGTGRHLIATFGIGLLSCLKVASEVAVRTYQRGEVPVELEIGDISAEVNPRESKIDAEGTTMIVTLGRREDDGIDVASALERFCIDVSQVDIYRAELDSEEELLSLTRAQLLALADDGSLERLEPSNTKDNHFNFKLAGEGFQGELWIDEDSSPESLRQLTAGEVSILSEGLFVTSVPAAEWLPRELRAFSGRLNFQAQAVNLSASRDAVRDDALAAARRRELEARARQVITHLASLSASRPATRTIESFAELRTEDHGATLILNSMFEALLARKAEPAWFLEQLDSYVVARYEDAQVALGSIVKAAPDRVYIVYGSGNTVSHLGDFAGQRLFNEIDGDLVVESGLLHERGELVIVAENFLLSPPLNEKVLLTSYFKAHGIPTVDVAEEHPMIGKVRSRGISKVARDALGANVKFVEVTTASDRLGWRMGKEVWLNTAHPSVGALFRKLNMSEIPDGSLQSARVATMLIGTQFDDALDVLFRSLDIPTVKRS